MDEIMAHPFVNLENKKAENEKTSVANAQTAEANENANTTQQQQQQENESQPTPNSKVTSPVQVTQSSAEIKEIKDIRAHTFKSELAQNFADRLKVDSLPLEQLKAVMEDVEKAHSPLNKQPKNTNGDSSFAEIKCEIEAIHRYLEKQMAAQQHEQSSTQQNKHKAD